MWSWGSAPAWKKKEEEDHNMSPNCLCDEPNIHFSLLAKSVLLALAGTKSGIPVRATWTWLLARWLQWIFCSKTWCSCHHFEKNWTAISSEHLNETMQAVLCVLESWATKGNHWLEFFAFIKLRMVIYIRKCDLSLHWNFHFERTVPLTCDTAHSQEL